MPAANDDPGNSGRRLNSALDSERAGLIARGRAAQWRPCRLQAAPLRDVADWLDQYRRFWDESFDRLDDYLHELQARDSGPGTDT